MYAEARGCQQVSDGSGSLRMTRQNGRTNTNPKVATDAGNKGTGCDVYQQTMEAWNETRKRVGSYLVKTGAVFMRWRQADWTWTSWGGKKWTGET